MRPEPSRYVPALVLLMLPALMAAGATRADSSDERRHVSTRRPGFGLALGFGHGLAARGPQVGEDVVGVRLLAVDPHLRLPLMEPGNGGAWYHGRLEAMLEGSALVNFSPNTGYAIGGLIGLRYRFLPGRRIQPYAEGGLGATHLAFDLNSQGNGLSFLLHAGLGLRWPLGETTALTFATRWHHISNAQSRIPNAGIDDVLLMLGLER